MSSTDSKPTQEMAYKLIPLFVLAVVSQSGCSFVNMFNGPDHIYRHYYAEEIKESIDVGIQSEVLRISGPPGHAQEPYTKERWNASWNDRIFHIYGLEKRPNMKAYRGPTGAEFIRYIIEERRSCGLPELIIEERNKDRVP